MSFHIIGDQDTVLGYRFAGITGDAVTTPDEARDAFRRAIASPEPGVLLVTETIADMLDAEITAHRLTTRPPHLAVVPDIWGRRTRRKSLSALISEAVGIKIVDSN